MGRREPLVPAVVGLVSLVGWYVYVFARDAQLMNTLQAQDAVVAGSVSIYLALRIGWPLVVVALACMALLQTIRESSVRGWFIAVLVVLIGPLVLRGLPLRLNFLPYYLISALYLVLAVAARNPRRKT